MSANTIPINPGFTDTSSPIKIDVGEVTNQRVLDFIEENTGLVNDLEKQFGVNDGLTDQIVNPTVLTTQHVPDGRHWERIGLPKETPGITSFFTQAQINTLRNIDKLAKKIDGENYYFDQHVSQKKELARRLDVLGGFIQPRPSDYTEGIAEDKAVWESSLIAISVHHASFAKGQNWQDLTELFKRPGVSDDIKKKLVFAAVVKFYDIREPNYADRLLSEIPEDDQEKLKTLIDTILVTRILGNISKGNNLLAQADIDLLSSGEMKKICETSLTVTNEANQQKAAKAAKEAKEAGLQQMTAMLLGTTAIEAEKDSEQHEDEKK